MAPFAQTQTLRLIYNILLGAGPLAWELSSGKIWEVKHKWYLIPTPTSAWDEWKIFYMEQVPKLAK